MGCSVPGSRRLVTLLMGLLAATSAVGAAPPPDPRDQANWSVTIHVEPIPVDGPPALPLQLVLDDGSREADIGFGAAQASQFLWFNRFDLPSPGISLEQIQVLFPPGPGIASGDAVQLVVYYDPDGDPTNGAQLLTAFDDTIQALDGTTFSTYPVDPPLLILGSGDVLIGVVNRYVQSGVSPPSRPAAIDTTAPAGRSWVALWTGDPPLVPDLPPDQFISTIDFIEPGNWMIRGLGSPVPVLVIPTLDRVGLALLSLLVVLLAVRRLGRRVTLRESPGTSRGLGS